MGLQYNHDPGNDSVWWDVSGIKGLRTNLSNQVEEDQVGTFLGFVTGRADGKFYRRTCCTHYSLKDKFFVVVV